ncbi:creatininase family protein [Candidatus Bathyarchaeota archaeon]|nr:creatininase family protein [Candidatus Bathyarchaeota archaeon]
MGKILYEEMSWPEIKKAVKEERVPLIPVGSTEQHGPHLPTMTDAFLCFEVCKRAAEKIPSEAVVLPPLSYGYNEHHLDFPATIHIDFKPWIDFLLCICKSLAHHGFRRIIIVNGHGSNTALAEIAARRATLETNALCASLTYLNLGWDKVKGLLEGECGHAGELETSLMLYLKPELVDMSKARRDWSYPKSKYIRWGWSPEFESFAVSGGNVQFMDWISRISNTGVLGDPTKATREKGRRILEIFVDELANFISEFRKREIKERRDHH